MLGTSNININLLQRKQWQPTPVFLPGESQGWGSLVGCRPWGRTGSDMTEATSQQQHLSTSSPMLFQSPTMCKVQHGATEMMSIHKPQGEKMQAGTMETHRQKNPEEGEEVFVEKRHPSFAQRAHGPSVPELEPTSLVRCPPALRRPSPSNTQYNC